MKPRLKIAFSVLGIGGALLSVYGANLAYQRHELNRAWSEFAMCTVGTEPLGDELPSRRLRRIDLAIAKLQDAGTPPAAPWGDDWRCNHAAEKLERAWTKSVGQEGAAKSNVGESLQMLFGELSKRPLPLSSEGRSALDSVFRGLAEIPIGKADGELPPTPLGLPELNADSRLGGREELAEVQPVISETVRFRLLSGGGAWVIPGGDAREPRAEWVPLSPEIPRGYSVTIAGMGTAPERRVSLNVSEDERGGAYDYATGKRLVAAWDAADDGSWEDAEGRVASLDLPWTVRGAKRVFSETYRLVSADNGGQTQELELKGPRYRETSGSMLHVVAGQVLWLELRGGQTEVRMLSLTPDLKGVSEPVLVGELPDDFRPIMGHSGIKACVAGESVFIDLRVNEAKRVLLVKQGERWGMHRFSEAMGRFGCTSAGANYALLKLATPATDGLRLVGQVEAVATHCTRTVCKTDKAGLSLPGVSEERMMKGALSLFPVGEKFLLLSHSSAMGLSVSVAPLSGLQSAERHLIADDDIEGGNQVFRADVLPAVNAAYVLLNHEGGDFVFRVSDAGPPQLLSVKR